MHKTAFASMPLLVCGLLAQGTPEVEPNNTYMSATAVAVGAQADGAISVAGDVDCYRFTLTSPADVRVWVNPGRGSLRLNDSDLTLFSVNGTTQISFNDDVNPLTNWLSRVDAGNLAAGTYYVRVRASQAFSPNAIGAYTLDIVAHLPGTFVALPLTPIAESAENNDPRPGFGSGTATGSVLPSRNSGFIEPPLTGTASGTSATTFGKDYDFYRFDVATTGVHTFLTTSSPGAPAPVIDNTVIRLFDSTFASLAFSDDFGGGPYSQLAFDITTPGTYYVAVSGYFGATAATPSSGNYILEAFSPPYPMPTGVSTVTVYPGGCGPTLGIRSTTAPPIVATEVPVLGSTFYVDGGNLPPNAPLMHIIGLFALATPYDLGPLGAPGCLVEVNPLDQSFAVADAAGLDYWAIRTPAAVVFINLPIRQQVAALDPTANALGVSISNLVYSRMRIQN